MVDLGRRRQSEPMGCQLFRADLDDRRAASRNAVRATLCCGTWALSDLADRRRQTGRRIVPTTATNELAYRSEIQPKIDDTTTPCCNATLFALRPELKATTQADRTAGRVAPRSSSHTGDETTIAARITASRIDIIAVNTCNRRRKSRRRYPRCLSSWTILNRPIGWRSHVGWSATTTHWSVG